MTIIAFTHTGAETYEQMVEMGLEVQPVHAGMSRFAHPDEAWDLYYRPIPAVLGGSEWRLLKVGQEITVEVGPVMADISDTPQRSPGAILAELSFETSFTPKADRLVTEYVHAFDERLAEIKADRDGPLFAMFARWQANSSQEATDG